MKISISMKIFGNFQTSLTQFLEGVRTNQRYHDDRTDVLVLSAKSDRNLRFRIWDVNEDFESEISMKILKCCFFSKEFQQKLKQNPIFKNTELFWRKIPFYRKSHFTWRNLVRFGKPIIPFYRDPILSRMYCISRNVSLPWKFEQHNFIWFATRQKSEFLWFFVFLTFWEKKCRTPLIFLDISGN